MLSEKRDGPDPDGQNALKAEKKEISRSEQRKWNRRILLCCVLGVGHRPLVSRFGDDASGSYCEAAVQASLNVLRVQKVLGSVCHALFDPRSLYHPDRRNKQGLRPRQDSHCQCECRQRPDRHADPSRPLKIHFGKQEHRHHYTDGQSRRPVVSMDQTEAFTAH